MPRSLTRGYDARGDLCLPRWAQTNVPLVTRWGSLHGAGFDIRLAGPDEADVLGDFVLAGTYTPAEPILLTLGLVSAGSVLLDVGAYLGTLSLPAAASGASVIAVEAAPTNLEHLRASVRANGLRGTRVEAPSV